MNKKRGNAFLQSVSSLFIIAVYFIEKNQKYGGQKNGIRLYGIPFLYTKYN